MLSVAAFMMCDSDDTHIEISFHEEEVEVEPTEFDNPTALMDTESQELTDMMSELTDSNEDCSIYTNRYLKQLLQYRYGEHIYFAPRPGREDVVGFSNFCDLSEIREQQCKREFYPTADDIISEGTRFVPSLLNCLLECVIRSSLKQASIGQAIVQAAKATWFVNAVTVRHCG